MRKLTPECKQALIETKRQDVNCGIVLPTKAISLGTGEDTQFFVLKYSDKFVDAAMFAYMEAVDDEARELHRQGKEDEAAELEAYSLAINNECIIAGATKQKIPD